MTIEEIEKLKPEFKFGDMTMIEWFEVHRGFGFCVIKSGLNHADGITKSPYHYDYFRGGDNATDECIQHFTEWWETKKSINPNQEK